MLSSFKLFLTRVILGWLTQQKAKLQADSAKLAILEAEVKAYLEKDVTKVEQTVDDDKKDL